MFESNRNQTLRSLPEADRGMVPRQWRVFPLLPNIAPKYTGQRLHLHCLLKDGETDDDHVTNMHRKERRNGTFFFSERLFDLRFLSRIAFVT